MTRDDIIRWAKEAGHPYPLADEQFLADYTNLVIEMCAKVAEDRYFGNPGEFGDEVAAAIRARKDSA